MIIGVGTDIVRVERIRRALEDLHTGGRFRERVFTGREIDYCAARNRAELSFAVRFAAKEAAMKALGRGFGDGIAWREIEVVRESERPQLVLHGKAKERADALGVTHWHLSLSHTATDALAFVVAERA